MNEVMSEYLADSQLVHLFPGDINFVKIQLKNNGQTSRAYKISIDDPDFHLFKQGQEEVRMVYTPHEVEYWAKRGKVKMPPDFKLFVS